MVAMGILFKRTFGLKLSLLVLGNNMCMLSRFRFIVMVYSFCIFLIPAIPVYSTDRSIDEPFTGPSNWGGTGLMEIPTARVMKENTFRFGVSLVDPYLHYYGAISPFKGLEFDFRVTEILGTKITSPGWESYGNDKTKVVDMKYQIIPEGKYLPALSIGIMDPHGTRQYASQYLVASKQIYPFDFTVGFGNGRYGEGPLPSQGEGFKIEMFEDPKQWARDSQLFWGIQLVPSDTWAFMVEYSPILYHKVNDSARDKYFREPVSSQYNFGFRYNLFDWASVDLSYQRGDTLGIQVSIPMDIGKPLIPLYDKPYRERVGYKVTSMEFRLYSALAASGFSDIGVEMTDGHLLIHMANSKYFYMTRALTVALSAMAPIVPRYDIEDITILFKGGSIPIGSVNMTKSALVNYAKYKHTVYETYLLPKFNTDYIAIPDNVRRKPPPLLFGMRPQFNFFLNDPSGFLKVNLGLSLWTSYTPWTGGSVVAGVAIYPFTSISSENEPLSNPVKSDVVDYLEKKILFDRLMFNQFDRIPNTKIYTSFSAGFLDMQYAGFDAAVATPLFGGRVFLGLSGSIVKKRDPDNPIKLKSGNVKDYYSTAFLNTRLNFPRVDVSVDIKSGKFLGGDIGSKVTVSKFIRGVTVSAWYSFTDTSGFQDQFNRGYHEKGLSVRIPMRLVKGTDTRSYHQHNISAWTRDVAQDIGHFRSIFDFIGRNVEVYFEKDVGAR